MRVITKGVRVDADLLRCGRRAAYYLRLARSPVLGLDATAEERLRARRVELERAAELELVRDRDPTDILPTPA